MAVFEIMPKQGLQMEEGTITEWLVEEGANVEEGQPLFEMETDKLTITIDAHASGTLLKILAEPGDEIPITKPIAIVGEEGEDISELLEEARKSLKSDSAEEPEEPEEKEVADKTTVVEPTLEPAPTADSVVVSQYASPRAKEQAAARSINYQNVKGSGPDGFVIERDVLAYSEAQPKSTPLAKVVAQQAGVSLADVEGSGYGGKISVDDVCQSVKARKSVVAGKSRGERLLPLSGMRSVVANRMKSSLDIMAQANHQVDVDMSAAVALRNDYKAMGEKVSYNDIIMRCTVRALTEFPMMNSSMTDEGIIIKDYVNMGMAVALVEGLIVPVIKDADLLSLSELSAVATDLASRAKESRLQPYEYTGGTFTVTNLGMYDITSFTAIINPPEAGILAVGKMEKRAVVRDDEIVIRPMATLSITYDHRIVDGAPAAEFLRRVKQLVEKPHLLI